MNTVVVDGITIVTNSILEDKTVNALLEMSEPESADEEKGDCKITPA